MHFSDKDFLRKIGSSISALRKKQGLTQADLAHRIGMEVPNLSVIENGKSNPQILTLLKIAAALRVNLPELMPSFDNPDIFLESPAEYHPRKHKRNTINKENTSTGL